MRTHFICLFHSGMNSMLREAAVAMAVTARDDEEKKEIITIGIEWNVTGNVIVCATVIFWQFWLRRSETSGVGGVAQLLSPSRYVAQGSKSLCVSSPQYASLASVEEKQRKKIYIEEMLVLVDRVLTATNKNDFYRD